MDNPNRGIWDRSERKPSDDRRSATLLIADFSGIHGGERCPKCGTVNGGALGVTERKVGCFSDVAATLRTKTGA
jgi:hypothetical protein